MPNFLYRKSKDITVTAYGASIQTQKITRKKKYIAVDPFTETCVERTIDKERGKAIFKRFKKIESIYKRQNENVEKIYRSEKEYLTSEAFWLEYLGLTELNNEKTFSNDRQ